MAGGTTFTAGSGISGPGGAAAGPSSTGIGGAFYAAGASASETDGDTFDGDADFDEYEDWDYNEILANVYVYSSLMQHSLTSSDR